MRTAKVKQDDKPKIRTIAIDYFNRLWDYPEEGSSNPGLGSGVHQFIREITGAMESLYIPLPPVVKNYRVGQLGRR